MKYAPKSFHSSFEVIGCCRQQLSMWRYTNIKRQIGIKNILKFFLIQEKVYVCKRNNLEYVKYRERNKGEYVNYEKKDIR